MRISDWSSDVCSSDLLAASDVDGIDLRRAARQRHVGEAAGRGADVEAAEAGGVDREAVEGMRQLDAAARYPGMILAAQRDRRMLGGAHVWTPVTTAHLVCRLLAEKQKNARCNN